MDLQEKLETIKRLTLEVQEEMKGVPTIQEIISFWLVWGKAYFRPSDLTHIKHRVGGSVQAIGYFLKPYVDDDAYLNGKWYRLKKYMVHGGSVYKFVEL